jgi:ornithine--oxo-acid transaminase
MRARFGYDKMVGMVSGTEGADAAVKFARKWGIKRKGIPPRDVLVLGVSDNYHGVGSGIWPIMNDMGQSSGRYCVLGCQLFSPFCPFNVKRPVSDPAQQK